MEKDRKVEKFHAELIIRQQKCGKVDLKGLIASQTELLRREIWRKLKKKTKRTTNLKQSCMINSAQMRLTKQAMPMDRKYSLHPHLMQEKNNLK